MAEKTLQQEIEDAAKDGIASVSVDGISVTRIPLKDRIEAEQFLTQKAVKSKNHLGLTFRQFKPGGCG